MNRVSSSMMNDDMRFWLSRREKAMSALETSMATQSRITDLRDDPLGAARAVRYDSALSRLGRYDRNAAAADDRYRVTEGYMRESQDILQRMREIAVQGANGVYGRDDMAAMASEVDQLIAELASVGNARGPDGSYLFAGDKSFTEPFRVTRGRVAGSGGEAITGVDFIGSPSVGEVEIGEGARIPDGMSGDEAFWAERQQIIASLDARSYSAKADASIVVNGQRIDIKAGDGLQAVAARINDSGAAVKASVDPVRGSLMLEGTTAARIRLEDGPGGSVLRDLGIARADGGSGGYAPTVRVSGGSIFDVAMRLRDSLLRGDVIDTGGQAIAGMDAALGSMGAKLAEVGSRVERITMARARMDAEIPATTRLLAAETDLDITEAITSYKMMEYARQAALGVAGKLLPRSLLDFLQ